jgi:hypothetical protein
MVLNAVWRSVFFGAKLHHNVEKKEYNILFLQKKRLLIFGPYVDSDFSLVAFLKLVFTLFK